MITPSFQSLAAGNVYGLERRKGGRPGGTAALGWTELDSSEERSLLILRLGSVLGPSGRRSRDLRLQFREVIGWQRPQEYIHGLGRLPHGTGQIVGHGSSAGREMALHRVQEPVPTIVKRRVEERYADPVPAVDSHDRDVAEMVPQGRIASRVLDRADDVAADGKLELQVPTLGSHANVLFATPFQDLAVAVEHIDIELII